ALRLSPDQHTEEQFKQILGGGMSVVNGLSSLRNKLSDSHGRGARHIKPSRRHAALCVNMAGTIAEFLIETLINRNEEE
ncbi:MAG: abortive infection family protein, partial [Clostridiales Family XIII bacterium]|nr:abortive infection family protein [Clostridiales Family XIII bacterium]